VAIIMDGNGRWAKQRGLPRILGHRAGAEAVRRVVEACCALEVPALTLYAFSWENRRRPADEVHELMGLLEEFLIGETKRLHANQVRLQAMGRLELLPEGVRTRLAHLRAETAPYRRLTLTLALNYGGRQELVDAMRALAQQVQQGSLAPEQITEAAISRALYLPELPEPDLLIRTSGEQRLSNFLLWQLSYCELYLTPTLWPDFTADDLQEALTAYQQRERRFGNVAPVSDAVGG
jgi:undecaprenyl diphosphate synthase